jgi:transcriptional regulator with XRE-family HTH domain
MNKAATSVKAVLPKESAAPESVADGEETFIGEQIRALRKIKGLTLNDVAAGAGISTGYLSQIERNRSKLPIGILKKIADMLGVQMSWFFQPETIGPPEEKDLIVRAGRRRKMSFTHIGITEELLSPNLLGPIELLLSTIDPGCDSGFYSHGGSEAGFVIEGKLDLWVGEKLFHLEAGDSFSFASAETHRCANPGKIATKVVWVITPPHY